MSRQSAGAMLQEMICPTVPYEPLPDAAPKLLTAREAAKALSISERTLARLTADGELSVVRLGRSIRFDPRVLSRWIEKSLATAIV
jgi:excisionase family DNA binding protein